MQDLEVVARSLTTLCTRMGRCSLDYLEEELEELKEEQHINVAIKAEEQMEADILEETRLLLVLQAKRHAAELPRMLSACQLP